MLGIGEKAFNARKKRGSFPEKELRALAQQRPELGIDVEYVLTGAYAPQAASLAQMRAYADRPLDPHPHERLQAELLGHGLDRAQAAVLLGVEEMEMNALLAGRRPLTDAMLRLLAERGLDVLYVLFGKNQPYVLEARNQAEKDLLTDYRSANVEGQAIIRACAKAAREQAEYLGR